PCGEWYLMLYLCATNAGAIVFALWAMRIVPDPSFLVAVGLVIFVIQFWTVTAHTYEEDLDREHAFGTPLYSFLPHGRRLGVFKIFDIAARGIERTVRWRRG